MDYGIGSISVYDPADIMPYNEPPISEQIRFKKLGKEMKSEFKWLVSSVVIGKKTDRYLSVKKCRNSEPDC